MVFGGMKVDLNKLTNPTSSLPGITDALANMGMEKAREALAQVNLLLQLLQSAGYGVGSMEIELSLSPKITITLKATPAVKEEVLDAILRDNADKKIVVAIVASLVQANKLRGSVTVETLELDEVEIVLTTTPNITMQWKDTKAAASATA
jgi:hypothetical protein